MQMGTNITDGSGLMLFVLHSHMGTNLLRLLSLYRWRYNFSKISPIANDGVNLVSFEDDQFPFSYGVLAVAAKTLKIDPTTQVAQIIDPDIVVILGLLNSINYSLGY